MLIDVQALACDVLDDALAGKNLSETWPPLAARANTLSVREIAQARDAVWGTLRHLGLMRAQLGALASKPIKDDALRTLVALALYQLQFTRAAPHAIVDAAVTLAGKRVRAQAKALVNALLRAFLKRRAELDAHAFANDLEARYNHPRWWIEKLRAQWPQDWQAMLGSAQAHPPFTLRINARRVQRDVYLRELDAAGMRVVVAHANGALTVAPPVPVDELPGFAEGRVSVQDAAAQWAPLLLDLHPGQRVLDACAAPGGKAAHMLETAAVDLLALDRDASRLARVRATLERLSLRAETVCADATDSDAWWDGRPFERVLIDAPCSASGVVRRHPDIKWTRRPADIAHFVAQQRRLLDALWRVLAPGGKLLYVTCSVFAEENHEQIAAFLSRHPDARPLPFPISPAHGFPADGRLAPADASDGFFYALLGKP